MNRFAATAIAVYLSGSACAPAQEAPVSKTASETAPGATGPEETKLSTMTARFAPTEIPAALSRLSAAERQILTKLVQASQVMDTIYLRQVWAGNDAML